MINKEAVSRFKKISISPGGKTFTFSFSVIVSGILCGWFIVEITQGNKIIWGSFYTVASFYFLLAYLIFVYIYNRYIYQHEKKVCNFLDDDYCRAYLRSECMPELVKKYRESIQKGKVPEELNDIHKEIKKILKK